MTIQERAIALHHLRFTVADLDRMVRLYSGLLGFKVRCSTDYEWDADVARAVFGRNGQEFAERHVKVRIAVLELGGTRLDFIEAIEPKITCAPRERGFVHIGVKVRDLREVRSRLEKAGVTFPADSSVHDDPYTGRWMRCVFTDPEGITVELMEEAPRRSLSETLGLGIRDARIARGLTLKEVGEMCEISAAHLSQVERGDAFPSVPVLVAISSALGVPPDFLLRFEEGPGSVEISPRGGPRDLRCSA